jgi:hypothetical protein
VRRKLLEHFTPLLEFALFLFATLFFWAAVDLCRYLISHRGPTEAQFLWVGAIFTFLWVSAGILRDYIVRVYRSFQTLEIAQPAIEPQLEQQPEA